MLALLTLPLSGCYESHMRPGNPAEPADDASVARADRDAVAECAVEVDGCALPTDQACVSVEGGPPQRFDAAAFIATGILDLELTTEGASRVRACAIEYAPGAIDRLSMHVRGPRGVGTFPVCADLASCSTAHVHPSAPAGPFADGVRADGGAVTFTTFEERPGGRICGTFSLTAGDRVIARGTFHATLAICDN
jgi:hypothetical protein